MDIRSVIGDITTAKEGVILHGCNNAGVMGSGVAKAISDKFPVVREKYLEMFSNAKEFGETIRLGQTQFVGISEKLMVANGITQDGFGSDGGTYATAEAIEACMMTTASMVLNSASHAEYRRIHMPKIGGERGGLDFDRDVMPIVEQVAFRYPEITFIVWTYDNRNPEYT